ncbi:MAG TPA: RNA polymerase sigma factor [Planctomycetota bacterium]|nr:RNA polymerase sigma factor [Planctomycetota bacterium]
MDPLSADEFTDAFARHGPTLWMLAAAWVGRGEAADLVQETARVAWQRREQFVPGSDLRAWLSQIARHLGANWRRRRCPEPRANEQLPEPHSTPEPRATSQFDAEGPFDADCGGLSDELARALADLPEVARACLLLHVVIGHSFTEIATLLDIPENTAASHTRRARLAMRTALASASFDPTPVPESP